MRDATMYWPLTRCQAPTNSSSHLKVFAQMSAMERDGTQGGMSLGHSILTHLKPMWLFVKQ